MYGSTTIQNDVYDVNVSEIPVIMSAGSFSDPLFTIPHEYAWHEWYNEMLCCDEFRFCLYVIYILLYVFKTGKVYEIKKLTVWHDDEFCMIAGSTICQ